MNTFIAPILIVIVLQLTVILSHPCNESEYPLIKTTACPRAAYTFGYSGFKYVQGQFLPVVPKRSYVAKINEYPYVYRLREKLTIGQAITIRGKIPNTSEAAAINLLSKTPVDDMEVGATPFHMSIRIGRKECVFTWIKDGKWEPEEKRDLSLRYNEEFEVVIRALTDGFEILINGDYFANFPYRMPLEIIDSVNVQYSAIITELRIGGRYFKNISRINFPGGYLKQNERIIIEGFAVADKFQINLLDAKGLRAFHMRPFFEPGVVITNSEPFGQQQIDDGKPFLPNKRFVLELTNRNHGIEIYINRAYFTTFKHRISYPEFGYKALGFDGSVSIEGVEICTKSRLYR
uniref:Galectin n=1 Tax=Panagrellus redivivus TaxID=6233 RepID=A0A7E4W4V8_PANRE